MQGTHIKESNSLQKTLKATKEHGASFAQPSVAISFYVHDVGKSVMGYLAIIYQSHSLFLPPQEEM